MDIALAILAAVQSAAFIVWAWGIGVAVLGNCKDKGTERAAGDSRHKFCFAVLICAHNEEKVIGGCLDCLMAQTYPKDRFLVYLIADRCTDNTCSIAQQYDLVTILCREDVGESRKGLALQWGIRKVLEREEESPDIIMVLDADNQVTPEFLELFNEKFCQGSHLVTGRRVAINPYQTLVSKWYAIYWSIVTELFCYPHSRLGLSSLLSGTGFAFSVSILGGEGFSTSSMSEDIEFSIQQNLKGIRVDYLEEAVYYDEQPVSVRTAIRQLRRWSTGGHQITRHYTGKIVKRFCKMPSLLIWDSFLTLLISGNAGVIFAVSVAAGMMGIANGGLWAVYALLSGLIVNAAILIISIDAVRRSRLDMCKILVGILLFPVFCLLYSCVSLYSYLRPQTKWHKIEHHGFGETGRKKEGDKGK